MDHAAPIDADLWAHASAAIRAIRDKVQEVIAAGGWYPTQDTRKLSQFDGGWPNLSVDRYGRSGPPAIDRMFGKKASTLTPLTYDDVPEVIAFHAYVRSRQDLIGTLLPLPREGRGLEEVFSDLFMNHLLFGVAGRCEALSLEGDAVLRVYLEAERSVLAKTLPAELVVPVLLADFGTDHAVQIDANVRIEPLNEHDQLARARDDFWSAVPRPLAGAATHAVVVGGVELANASPWYRLLGHQYDLEAYEPQVERALRAIRCLTPQPIGYAQVLLRPLEWADTWYHDLPPLFEVRLLRRYPDEFDDRGWLRERTPLPTDVIERLPQMYSALDGSNKRLAIAAKRLDIARMRTDPDDKVIDACVGLEALLGQERTEITHRLAQRAAVLLHERLYPKVVYEAMYGVYARRSEIVHGEHTSRKVVLKVNEANVPADGAALFFLSECITEIVFGSQDTDPQSLDRRLLERLETT